MPAMLTVWVGSTLACPQLEIARARTNPDALSIVMRRCMYVSPLGFTLCLVLGSIIHPPLWVWLRMLPSFRIVSVHGDLRLPTGASGCSHSFRASLETASPDS